MSKQYTSINTNKKYSKELTSALPVQTFNKQQMIWKKVTICKKTYAFD